MKKSLKIALIVCLILGIGLIGLSLYCNVANAQLADLRGRMAAYNQAQQKIKAAELLGQDASGIEVPEEVVPTSHEKFLISMVGAQRALLVLGIDLALIGLIGMAYGTLRSKRKAKTKVAGGNSVYGILIAFLILCFNLALATNVFLTPSNFLNVFQQISTNFVVAVGMTFVIISGGIDLSVGSNIALSGLLMAIMMKNWNVPVFFTILLCILFSGLIGACNGALITFLHLPPFIATLGTMYIVRGAAYTVTAGQPLYTMPSAFTAISSRVMNIPLWNMLIMATVMILGWYLLKYTSIGRFTYAIGGNESCARLSGISLNKTKIFVYTVSGLCCGVAALLLTSRLDSAVPTNADGQEMDAIAAVVIGGTSMSGGEGSMIGTLIGILIIGVIANGLNLLGVAQGPQRMVKGALIVVAVIIDVMRRKAAESAK